VAQPLPAAALALLPAQASAARLKTLLESGR